MTGRPSRAGATGPTLLVSLCGLLGLTAACILALPWQWLGAALCAAIAALLIAAYHDTHHDPIGADQPMDAADAIRLANDHDRPPPTTAAELGRQLVSDTDVAHVLRQWNRDQGGQQ